jgi:hypothetical protein
MIHLIAVLWIRILLNLDPDPDQAFQVNRIRYRIRIQGFDDQKNEKKCFFYIFFIKNLNLLILRPSYRTSKLQEKPSALKRDHPALQKMKLINCFLFIGSFYPPGSGSSTLDNTVVWSLFFLASFHKYKVIPLSKTFSFRKPLLHAVDLLKQSCLQIPYLLTSC